MSERVVYAQMHCHSRYSINPLSGEGAFHRFIWPVERQIMRLLMKSPTGLLRLANDRGVTFVAITDHNQIPLISGHGDFLISGEEWGQTKGHSNFINLNETIDPECGYYDGIEPDKPNDFRAAVTEAKKKGAFVSINHPFKADSWEWGEDSYGLADAIEIWNGPWSEENVRALELWQNLLAKGSKIWCLAGNDFHVNHLFKIDSQVVAVLDVQNKESLISKLKTGDFSIAKDSTSPVVFIGRDLKYRIENYKSSLELRLVSSDSTRSILNPVREGLLDKNDFKLFIRLEIWEGVYPLSFSNPVFF